MPRKVRELAAELLAHGFAEIAGDDAKPYREKQVRKALEAIHGDDPVHVYADLAHVVEEVIAHFEKSGQRLPPPRVRPMQEFG